MSCTSFSISHLKVFSPAGLCGKVQTGENHEELTIADHKQHEGFIPQQPHDGGPVGVLIGVGVPGQSLGLGWRDLRSILKN